MRRLKVSAERQVTLGSELLDHLGVLPGDIVSVDLRPDGSIQVRAAPRGRISDSFGSLKHRGQRQLSIKEIGKIAADGWAGKR